MPDARTTTARERHTLTRLAWLRAAVLGANDGIVSTASLLTGLSASAVSQNQLLLAGSAGLIAGALSMATGEFVSVGAQAEAERADIQRERDEQVASPQAEHAELTEIYVRRGLTETLATEVATQLMAHDALGSHLRDELGMVEWGKARPLQAAAVSALSFAAGAVWPLTAATLAPTAQRIGIIAGTALLLLFATGAVAGKLGGASPLKSALRVGLWSAVAMGATTVLGRLLGTQLG